MKSWAIGVKLIPSLNGLGMMKILNFQRFVIQKKNSSNLRTFWTSITGDIRIMTLTRSINNGPYKILGYNPNLFTHWTYPRTDDLNHRPCPITTFVMSGSLTLHSVLPLRSQKCWERGTPERRVMRSRFKIWQPHWSPTCHRNTSL